MRQQAVCVGVADLERPFRAGVGAVLERAGYRVVGAGSLEPLAGLAIDLLLLDDRLFVPGAGAVLPSSTLVVAQRPTLKGLLRSLEAGAIGYLDRATSAERLLLAVEDAAAGLPVLPPALASLLFERWQHHGASARATRRQREVQLLRQQGLSTAEIAATLQIAPTTVRRHVMDFARRQRAA